MKNFNTSSNSSDLKEMMNSYDSSLIDSCPSSETQLYQYYFDNIDSVYQWLRNVLCDDIYVLGNEIRAMFGHICEYVENGKTDDNLKKAYGHFRRLSIDTFKVLCDELDKSFNKWLKRHYHYDYRNVEKDFLGIYSKKYFQARNAYTVAQEDERVGSDSQKHNIIQKYHEAATKYVDLYCYHQEHRQKIEKAKVKNILKKVIYGIFVFMCSVISILGLYFT